MVKKHSAKPLDLQRNVEVARPKRSIDGERLIAVFSQIVEPLGKALPASSEVVLHDLSLLPNSIVAVYGDATGRRVGDPATDLLLKAAISGTFETEDLYETVLPDGRRMRSTTMIIRDVSGTPVAALCINTDLSMWFALQRLTEVMLGRVDDPQLGELPSSRTQAQPVNEAFARDVEELAAHLIRNAVAAVGVPVELMKKPHKLEVVRDLKDRGMFLLRDAVDMIATALQVTRFTIYNYLNEIEDESNESSAVSAGRKQETA